MGAAVQRHDHLRIGQTVEGQRAGHADHMAAIDQPLAILAEGGVKMHLGGILPQPGGNHVLGLLDGDAIDMVDLLAHRIIAPTMRLACKAKVIAAEIQPFGDHKILRAQRLFQRRHHRIWCGNVKAVFPHHHPAHIVHHGFVALVQATGADIDHPGFAVGVFLQADHLRFRAQRVARPDRPQPAPFGIAEIGNRVQAHIRHGLAKYHMKRRQIVQRAGRQAAGLCESVRRIQRMPGGIERVIQRPLATRNRAGHRVADGLSDAVIFEKSSGVGLHHALLQRRGDPPRVSIRRA